MILTKHLNNGMTYQFKINEVDKYIFVKNIDKDYVLVIYLSMNDILILGNNDHMIKFTKKILTI